jgi:hypothetical protein
MTAARCGARLAEVAIHRGVLHVPANSTNLLHYAERVAGEARRAANSAATRAADAGERNQEARTRVAELRQRQARSWTPMRDADVAHSSRSRHA